MCSSLYACVYPWCPHQRLRYLSRYFSVFYSDSVSFIVYSFRYVLCPPKMRSLCRRCFREVRNPAFSPSTRRFGWSRHRRRHWKYYELEPFFLYAPFLRGVCVIFYLYFNSVMAILVYRYSKHIFRSELAIFFFAYEGKRDENLNF